jgi:hypothetical protein
MVRFQVQGILDPYDFIWRPAKVIAHSERRACLNILKKNAQICRIAMDPKRLRL